MKITFYQVGGALRDEILGIKSKDIDYAVEVTTDRKLDPFDLMFEAVKIKGYKVFLTKRDYLTIRASGPEGTVDFVLCRKDGAYFDNRHPESVEAGTIYDDLARRDFTINAMARGDNGVILDPHGGLLDLQGKVIRCVGKATARFSEDGLRMLRAIRFAITKGFSLDAEIVWCLSNRDFFESRLGGVSVERIREELMRCFKHDTTKTLMMLDLFRPFRDFVFQPDFNLWLKPTLESR